MGTFRNKFMFDVECGYSIECYQPMKWKKIHFQQKKYCAYENGQREYGRQVRNSELLSTLGMQNVFQSSEGEIRK